MSHDPAQYPPAEHSQPSLEPGQRIGPYEVIARFEHHPTAGALIAKAHGTTTFGADTRVVIKAATASAPAAPPQFALEAHIGAGHPHPNLAAASMLERYEDTWVLARKYVPGDDLTTLLQRCEAEQTPLLLPAIASWGAHLFAGLASLHERAQVVHGDVSPDNIVVDSATGQARLLDFGAARPMVAHHAYNVRGPDSHRSNPVTNRKEGTAASEVLTTHPGKLGYAAPEQFLGQAPDANSDVYSASIVIWELLTGRRCFQAETARQAAEERDRVVPPSSHRPDVPPELDALIHDVLSAQPHKRMHTAAQMLQQLKQVVAPHLASLQALSDVGVEGGPSVRSK